jgi:putative ATP-dependent endonuclease of OLD family
MNLSDIEIKNFRGIRSICVNFDKLTVLIGENNTGKSTVLEALRIVFNKGLQGRRSDIFQAYDFHLTGTNSTPQNDQPISLLLHFAEQSKDIWSRTIHAKFNKIIMLDINTGLNHIWLQVQGSYSSETMSFSTKYTFVNADKQAIETSNLSLNDLAIFSPLFFLSALRDASKEFGQRGQFWKDFLKAIQFPKKEREDIEQKLKEINSAVIEHNNILQSVIKQIAETKTIVSLDPSEPVSLETVSTRLFDIVNNIQVSVKSRGSVKLPLERLGEGTQSLAVLMLFQAFANLTLNTKYNDDSIPLLALEEPEAHLHPAAIRSVGTLLTTMTGQTFVTSHSGDLLSQVPLTAIRRMYRKNNEIRIGQIFPNLLTDEEFKSFDYSVKLHRGHFLFSRCWLLVEGESDFIIMSGLFDHSKMYLDKYNFSILVISQVLGKGVPFIKIAKALGIEWFLMTDSDDHVYFNNAKTNLEQGEKIEDRVLMLKQKDIEHEFWHYGYEKFIDNIAKQSKNYNNINTTSQNNKVKSIINLAVKKVGGKPALAYKLCDEMKRISKIPKSLEDVVKRVKQLTDDGGDSID